MKQVPGVVDVSTDREQGGLQLDVSIDRDAAARLGVRMQDIDTALANAYAQRQISTIYTQRNQYRVILEVDPRYQRDPNDLSQHLRAGRAAARRCRCRTWRSSSARIAPLVVNHQGQFPAVTISFGLRAGRDAGRRDSGDITQAVAEMHLPDIIHAEFAGDAQGVRGSRRRAAAADPRRAGRGLYRARRALREPRASADDHLDAAVGRASARCWRCRSFGAELTIIAFIGIILLIGIVKKNGIMLVDFALEAERQRGLPPERAIYEACMERFRPILMTTLAALLGAVPLVIATGPGSELRRPLGITIIGGLIVSQMLTLYTTPVIYLLLDRLHRRLGGRARERAPPQIAQPQLGPA